MIPLVTTYVMGLMSSYQSGCSVFFSVMSSKNKSVSCVLGIETCIGLLLCGFLCVMEGTRRKKYSPPMIMNKRLTASAMMRFTLFPSKEAVDRM